MTWRVFSKVVLLVNRKCYLKTFLVIFHISSIWSTPICNQNVVFSVILLIVMIIPRLHGIIYISFLKYVTYLLIHTSISMQSIYHFPWLKSIGRDTSLIIPNFPGISQMTKVKIDGEKCFSFDWFYYAIAVLFIFI